MAGFHQAVAQGAPGVGLAGAGQPEGQHDAALHDALGQQAPGGLGRAEGFPGLARGQPGLPASRLMRRWRRRLQDLQESCQGIAVSSGGETSHRLGGGQPGRRWPRSCITLVSVMAHPRRGRRRSGWPDRAAELRAPWAPAPPHTSAIVITAEPEHPDRDTQLVVNRSQSIWASYAEGLQREQGNPQRPWHTS